MKQPCKYHPTARGNWYCAHDGIYFCDDCVGGDTGDAPAVRCFLCNRALSRIPTALEQTPFWQIMPHFLRYPLMVVPLMLALLAALPLMLTGADWIGAVVFALAGLLVAAYGAAVLLQTADGQLRPPTADALRSTDWGLAIVGWLLYVATVIGVAALIHFVGLLAGMLLWVVLISLLPAFWLALISQRSPGKAFARIHLPMLVMGQGYTKLIVTLALTGALVLFTNWVFVDLFPLRLAAVLGAFLLGIYWLFVCHLLGYLACQFQQELDMETDMRKADLRRRRNRRPEEDRRFSVLMREGCYDKLLGALSARLQKSPNVAQINEQYMTLLSALGRHDAMVEQADNYIEVVLKDDKPQKVIALVVQLRASQPNYRPQAPDLCLRVAELFGESGDAKTAVALLQDIHQRAKGWQGVPDAYILMAKLLAELGLTGKAEQYLKFVEKNYKHPKVRQQLEACREAIATR